MEIVARRPGLTRWRLGLLAATGASLPLYAFPPFRVFGRPVDLATVAAALFVVSALPLAPRLRPFHRIAFAASALLPAAALLIPRPERFEPRSFAISYAHWILVTAFFAAAVSLPPLSESQKRVLLRVLGIVAALVAAYALYQIVGMPRGWPGTGPVLSSLQREPLRLMQVGRTSYVRPTSVFLEPAWLGGYLVFVIALVGGAESSTERKAARVSRLVLITVLAAVVLATVSWGAYGDLAAAGLALAVTTRSRGARIRLTAAAAALAVLLVAGLASAPGRSVRGAIVERWELFRSTRVNTSEGAAGYADSTWMRLRNVSHTFDLFLRHPLRGVGIGQFGRYLLEGQPYMVVRATKDPWCGWLASAAELGFGGPILLAIPFAVVLTRLRLRPRTGSDPAVWALLALAFVQQLHTGSYIDLWWWYPLSIAAVVGAGTGEETATMSTRT